MKTSIIIRFSIPGFHHWPQAPDEVAFLRTPHRHIFKFSVRIAVGHCGRAREFFMEQGALQHMVASLASPHPAGGLEFWQRSCEQIAADVMERAHDLNIPVLCVEVSEDGENSGVVEC